MFFCEKCQNTGGTEPGGDLDCTAPGCDAAVKRAEFNTWLLQMGWPDGRMKEWQIYRHGQREAQEEIAELKSRLNVADLRINAAIRAKLETEQRLFEVTQAAAEEQHKTEAAPSDAVKIESGESAYGVKNTGSNTIYFEAPSAPAEHADAWMTEDGERAVTARTMDAAKKDGGAMLSSMKPYRVPLVRALNKQEPTALATKPSEGV